MSKFSKLVLVALVAVFALSSVASAEDVFGEQQGKISDLQQAYRDMARNDNPVGLEQSEVRYPSSSAMAPPATGLAAPQGPCVIRTNQCPDFEEYWIWGLAGPDMGSRDAFSTQVIAALRPESVKTIGVYVIYDPDDELGFGAIYTEGDPDITVSLHPDDGAGLPDEGTTLATVTRTFSDWYNDPDLFVLNNYREGVLNFDVYSAGIVVPQLDKVHAVVRITAGGYIFVLTDEGGEAEACDNGDKSAHYRNGTGADPAGWYSMGDYYGFNYNIAMYYEMCEEAPPPVCENLMNHCDPDLAGSVTIFGMPRTVREAFANRYFGGQLGVAQACTVKALYPWFYENNDADTADVEIRIYESDGGGLPGAVLWSTVLDYETLVLDLSAPTPVTVPDVVVSGEFFVGYSAVNATVPPAATGGSITFVGTSLSGDIACEPYRTDAMYVLQPDLTWVDDVTFFGAESELWVSVDICCPQLPFEACTPASDLDWTTQGNNYARTNYSSASISSLCGLTLAWSDEPGGTIEAIQPVIAGDYVLVMSTDLITAYDKLSGTVAWSFGGFPYIVGAVKGAPTVAGDYVYFGGAGAQSITKVELATGTVVWSRNLGGTDVALDFTGGTTWTPPVVMGGYVYITQETGNIYKLDDADGSTVNAFALPDAPGAVPFNALTSDGTKLWVGTSDAIGTGGSIHQVDMATMAVDWSLFNPSFAFWGDDVFYTPEGFPGSMAFEDGILYYHSHIRDDANGFDHFPQTGAVGAIDVATELGGGEGILWVNDQAANPLASPGLTPSGTNTFSGPAVGPGYLYLGSRGFFGGTTEPDGLSAWDKVLGARVFYRGYTPLGVSGGVQLLDDVRITVPVSVFCQSDQTPYLFTGHLDGTWRLWNGNTGEMLWYRTMTNRVRGTAISDDCVAVATRASGVGGGGAIMVFTVGNDRPRLQIDSQYVFRTATPGDGAASDDVVDAFQNVGCLDLNVAYGVVNPPDPTSLRVTAVNPVLAAATERATRHLGGFDAFLDMTSEKGRAIARSAGVEVDEAEIDLTRTFANNLNAAADPLFLTVNTAAGLVAPGAAQTINVTYDETGLTNNTGYINYIELTTDDPDYYPQDPSGATLGLPAIEFNLFIGCPDASDYITGGNVTEWITNFGGTGDGDGGNGFQVNGHRWMYDGGWALVVQDSLHWALEGVSVGGYPRRAGEWGPTLPCGINIASNNYDSPAGVGADAVEEVEYNMLDLASTNGYFPASARQCGGVLVNAQRVVAADAAYADFALARVTITNEVGDFYDLTGALNDMYFGTLTDWDIDAGTNNNTHLYPNGSYASSDGGAAGKANATNVCGHVRLDADAYGSGPLAAGGAPVFLMGDMFNDQGHGDAAYRMANDPANYWTTVPEAGVVVQNTDIGAMIWFINIPSLADGASETFYFATYQIDAAAAFGSAAAYDAAVAEIQARAKAYAGFGKGDVNSDGVIDLTDVVALGNIVDGLLDPAGTGGFYAADVDGDNDYDQDDYDLLYDVVAGVQPASALANGWRF